MSYTHLQVRSGFSLMNSTITIDRLVAKAKEMNFSALALTDEGVLYGVIPFYKACKKVGIKPIIGLIIPVSREDNLHTKITLLAKNNSGYKNLIRLSTILQVEGREGITVHELSDHTVGL